MDKLENWTEITKGLYRYVISAGCCYEIHIKCWDHNTDKLSANSELYIVGDWRSRDGRSIFERESLFTGPLAACLEAAEKDNKENNS